MPNIKKLFTRIKGFAFDVDGVLTDGSVALHPGGDMMRSMNIKDGYAIQYCIKKNYPIAIITGGSSEMVKTRFANLGVTDIYLKSFSKLENLDDFRYKYSLELEDILYMGDDLPDYEVMTKVGLPTCPSDAVIEIKSISKYISHKNGGEGCVRDVIEQVMRVQGTWMDSEAFVW